jgi:hypothetical protein
MLLTAAVSFAAARYDGPLKDNWGIDDIDGIAGIEGIDMEHAESAALTIAAPQQNRPLFMDFPYLERKWYLSLLFLPPGFLCLTVMSGNTPGVN